MKRLLLTFAFVSLFFSTVWYAGVYASNHTITGSVIIDEQGPARLPLQNAQVDLYKVIWTVPVWIDEDTTDNYGEFYFPGPENGTYWVKVTKDSTLCWEEIFTVSGADVNLNGTTTTCDNP